MEKIKENKGNDTTTKKTVVLKVTLNQVLFPKPGQFSANGYSIVKYTCNDHSSENPDAVDLEGNDLYGKTFSAKGFLIPTSKSIQYTVEGTFSQNKYGLQLDLSKPPIEAFDQDEVGIMAYLTSGSIKGVGPKIARSIYQTFGNKTMDILDYNPERLSIIEGISKKKLEQIISSILETRSARATIEILAPLGISPKKSMKIYEKFKDESTDIVRNHPYRLCEVKGISFTTADELAMKQNVSLDSIERYEAGIIHVLIESEVGGSLFFKESSGNTCLPIWILLSKTMQLLGVQRCDFVNQQLNLALTNLKEKKEIVISREPQSRQIYIYRYITYECEQKIATNIVELLKDSKPPRFDIDKEIEKLEIKEQKKLAPEQKEAVKVALNNDVSVITGGPGTGKTTIINFIRKIYAEKFPNSEILLAAPTGRASRRMSEATNSNALTFHKSLGLGVNEDNEYSNPTVKLEYDLCIFDEYSMSDIFITASLFESIHKGMKVVIIGDVDQLSSVGCGNVLSDFIESGIIPVVRLITVYRQGEGSSIFTNSKLIKTGFTNLDYDNSFQFIDATDFQDAYDKMEKCYMQEIAINSVENVMMLSPFRNKKTLTGTESINCIISDKINPPENGKRSLKVYGKTFKEGDYVMQITRNTEEVSNGDVGFIIDIRGLGDDTIVTVDFRDGRIIDYKMDDLEFLTHAYAMSIHKSQGSEASVVIINLMKEHDIMLVKNLIYTAITRAKKKVIIIGHKNALITAINRTGTKRITLLAQRLRITLQKTIN